MAKYNLEFKIKIVQKYLDGEGGYAYLTKKYGVSSESQLINWVNAYKEFGEEGLFRKRQNQKYSVQFKLDAIELYQTSEMSYREVANTIGINNSPMIAAWVRKFRDDGIEGLSNPKGRPSNMTKKNKVTKKKISKVTPEESERIKALEKQVRSLQIENAFLKELRKLRKQEAQQRRKNQSHESSTASEDYLN
ncbi:transposase [Candidatus Vagococcus giribetii]|uniref:transposase n=1 Tax=Candidatus Vagococcus giribetii TaxID=2230876 RepID=UPI003F885525